MADPFGRAIRDHANGERADPLWQIDGSDRQPHPIEAFYFGDRDSESEATAWRERWIEGPFLDAGAGVGRDALYFQERVETVALESSAHLVTVMDDRGVEAPRHGDMFDLRATFGADRFRTVQSFGTQSTLAASPGALRAFLADLAYVTTADGRAILDGYDPTCAGIRELLGYRSVPESGVGIRTFHFEYEGTVGPTLLFRLVSPDRLDVAARETGWTVTDLHRGDEYHYDAVLEKR